MSANISGGKLFTVTVPAATASGPGCYNVQYAGQFWKLLSSFGVLAINAVGQSEQVTAFPGMGIQTGSAFKGLQVWNSEPYAMPIVLWVGSVQLANDAQMAVYNGAIYVSSQAALPGGQWSQFVSGNWGFGNANVTSAGNVWYKKATFYVPLGGAASVKFSRSGLNPLIDGGGIDTVLAGQWVQYSASPGNLLNLADLWVYPSGPASLFGNLE